MCKSCLVKEGRDNKTRSGSLTQPWACQSPSMQLSLRAVGPEVKPSLKPSYEFHFEGLSNFSTSVEELVQIQDINLRI
jgi:hypothetical protein